MQDRDDERDGKDEGRGRDRERSEGPATSKPRGEDTEPGEVRMS